MNSIEAKYIELLNDQPIGTYWISTIECAQKVSDHPERGWNRLPALSRGRSKHPFAIETDVIAYVMKNVTWSLS